ncbi:MAG: quinoprotein dehydrogenase-associated SoxYZ-like carrier [Alphaproteobacteria bacterium]|nr:quinoprotein dehydrogenase-associated SoxYZ-like carrier [Alphaproteobacteria bacterium]
MPVRTKSLALIGSAAALTLVLSLPMPSAEAKPDVWQTLKQQTFGDRAIATDGMVVLEMPDTAEDAALVPLTVRVPPHVRQDLKSLTLVIDNNPDPVIAKIAFGPAAGNGGERSFSTRVRVEDFSHVRAILETGDGELHMASKFVAAAGGCGALMAKDPDVETVDLGKMIVKTFPPALDSNPIWSGQVMIKHPNANGMQLDINTATIIPARYVKEMTVKRDGELVFKMEGTFSISTNPNFRFTYGRGQDNDLDVTIVDTDQTVFAGHSDPAGS